MEDNNQELGALTNHPVMVRLGNRDYSARLCNLEDVEFYWEKVEEIRASGKPENIVSVESTLALLCRLITVQPPVTAETIKREMIGTAQVMLRELRKALEVVGFTEPEPQPAANQTKNPTGVQSTPELSK